MRFNDMRESMVKSICTVLALCAAVVLVPFTTAAAQIYSPTAVSGFDRDLVAEDGPADAFAQPTDGTAGRLFSDTYPGAAGGGLPSSRMLIGADGSFLLNPYDQNNGLRLSAVPATLALATPQTLSAVRVLAVSADGDGQVQVVINFQDGTSELFAPVTVPDWYSGQPGAFAIANGRVADTVLEPSSTAPLLYAYAFPISAANATKTVVSLGLSNPVGANVSVLGVAAAPPPAPVPTLSEWAMILFGTVLAGGAALYIQRRRLTA